MVKIKKTRLKDFIDFVQQEYDVFAPTEVGKKTAFKKIDSAFEIIHDIVNTDRSPKEVFFPQSEVLFEYGKDGLKTPERKEKPIAVWGLRHCDTSSLTMLNKVFSDAHQMPDKDMFKDPYWKEKYDNSLIFNQACNTPLSTCFCHWFGRGPFDKTSSDIFVVDVDDVFLLEGISEKGKAFLAKYEKAEQATKEDEAKITELKRKAESFLAEKTDISELFEKIGKLWDEPIWEEISGKCVNCGACTFVCSTCHCFDVSDEGKKGKGKRIRLWDSCMFQLFTKEASGHNPRGISTQRVRQRFMHKYNYFMDNYGVHLCTGCGRCVQVCPVNLDVRELIKKVLDYKIS
ncbi:MAG: 4Fe-4S dicluster domain-containing protein [Candidatus Cloacimonadales bacterium]|nr:4Fe-4S dicluster domain-containing protein [Candidatus Cloacimonadales bacterium]